MHKRLLFALVLLGASATAQAQVPAPSAPVAETSLTDAFAKLLWPGLLAALGYVGKAIFDAKLAIRNRRISNLEDKLKLFYWPILLRLEKDNAVWKPILKTREDPASLGHRIGVAVEQEVLKNHREILAILDSYTYLAEPTDELTVAIKQYVKNVTLYFALRAAGDTTNFPNNIDPEAKFPEDFHRLIKERTACFQRTLDTLLF